RQGLHPQWITRSGERRQHLHRQLLSILEIDHGGQDLGSTHQRLSLLRVTLVHFWRTNDGLDRAHERSVGVPCRWPSETQRAGDDVWMAAKPLQQINAVWQLSYSSRPYRFVFSRESPKGVALRRAKVGGIIEVEVLPNTGRLLLERLLARGVD